MNLCRRVLRFAENDIRYGEVAGAKPATNVRVSGRTVQFL